MLRAYLNVQSLAIACLFRTSSALQVPRRDSSFFTRCFIKTPFLFFFQAEDGIRDFCLSRGLGDVYKRQRRGGAVTRIEVTQLIGRVRFHVDQTTPTSYCPQSSTKLTSKPADWPWEADNLRETQPARRWINYQVTEQTSSNRTTEKRPKTTFK